MDRLSVILHLVSMQRVEIALDMRNNRAVMINKPVKLDFISSSHYCINIMNNKNKNIKWEDQVLATAEDCIPKGKRNENE